MSDGDLAHRLLVSGLGTLLNTKPDYDVTLVGCAVDPLSQEEWVARVREALGSSACSKASPQPTQWVGW